MTPTQLRIQEAQSNNEIFALMDELRKDWVCANAVLNRVEDELLHINALYERAVERSLEISGVCPIEPEMFPM